MRVRTTLVTVMLVILYAMLNQECAAQQPDHEPTTFSNGAITESASVRKPEPSPDMIEMPPSRALDVPEFKAPEFTDETTRKNGSSLLLKGSVVRSDTVYDALTYEQARFGIIGIRWRMSTYPTVLMAHRDLPAYRAGIRAGDKIVAMDSHSLAGLSQDEVWNLLIHEPGTPITLSIEREGQLIAAVMIRMDVEDIKDPWVRSQYQYLIRRRSSAPAM